MRRSCGKPAAALRACYGIRCFVAPSPARDGVDTGVILPPHLRRGPTRCPAVPKPGLALTPALSVSGREVRGGGGAGEGRAFGGGSASVTVTAQDVDANRAAGDRDTLAFQVSGLANLALAARPAPLPAPLPVV